MINTNYKVIKGDPNELLRNNVITSEDSQLIDTVSLDTRIDQSADRVEIHVFSLDNTLLFSNQDFKNYTVIKGEVRDGKNIKDITLSPDEDVKNLGFINGDVKILYNFTRNLFLSGGNNPLFYIESISPDRTELRLLSKELENSFISERVNSIKSNIENSAYYNEVRVNFGANNIPIAVNIDFEEYKNNTAVLIKLYRPLSTGIGLKTFLSLEQLVADSALYSIQTETTLLPPDVPTLRGPNFDLYNYDDLSNPSEYISRGDVLNFPVTNSYYEALYFSEQKGMEVSADYTDFSTFIHFSSAQQRLEKFRNKIQTLQVYEQGLIDAKANYSIFYESSSWYIVNEGDYVLETPAAGGEYILGGDVTSFVTNDFTSGSFENQIKGIVVKFDHYDRFLYFESSSWAWPKSSTTKPYSLFSVTSSEAVNWYNTIQQSASIYDNTNVDRLINTIPPFITEDSNNQPYLDFVDMVGHYFDNIWIYIKNVTEKYNADNRLNFGISKDLVRDVLYNFGVKLYENNQTLENLLSSFSGQSYNTGSEKNVTNIISALDTTTFYYDNGSYYIVDEDDFVEIDPITGRYIELQILSSVSNTEQPVSVDRYIKEIQKRIYHNLPLLLKSKGTQKGLRTLINCFGVPDDILPIKVYGGNLKTSGSYFGNNFYVTSSIDNIRLDNTGSIVENTLSYYTKISTYDNKYNNSLNYIEVGFSPTDYIDKYILENQSSSIFNIDQYLGDPENYYKDKYENINLFSRNVFTTDLFIGGSGEYYIVDEDNFVEIDPIEGRYIELYNSLAYLTTYNYFDFIRLIKFFDNSLFRIVKDFIPARSVINSGIIIKPNILNRSKIKLVQTDWATQNIDNNIKEGILSGSLTYSDYFYLDSEVSVVSITGSNVDSFGNEIKSGNIVNRYLSSYSESITLPIGGFTEASNFHSFEIPKLTGEFSGSILSVSSVDLNRKNIFK